MTAKNVQRMRQLRYCRGCGTEVRFLILRKGKKNLFDVECPKCGYKTRLTGS